MCGGEKLPSFGKGPVCGVWTEVYDSTPFHSNVETPQHYLKMMKK